MQGPGEIPRRTPPSVRAYPAVPVAAAFIGGVALRARLPCLPATWFAASVVLLVALFLLRRRPVLGTVSALLAWACVGLLAGQLAAYRYPPADIGLYASDESRLAQLELKLDDPPRT
ncbi:MAG TPA: hypothetical protein VF796_24645, partial [Humisphaera sp.]